MRTTVSLDRDVAIAVDRLRREKGLGMSAALNELARQGLTRRPAAEPFRQRTSPMGARIDLSNVAEALELLDREPAR